MHHASVVSISSTTKNINCVMHSLHPFHTTPEKSDRPALEIVSFILYPNYTVYVHIFKNIQTNGRGGNWITQIMLMSTPSCTVPLASLHPSSLQKRLNFRDRLTLKAKHRRSRRLTHQTLLRLNSSPFAVLLISICSQSFLTARRE